MVMPREGSLLLGAFGNLTIVWEPIAVSVAWNLMDGMEHPIRDDAPGWPQTHVSQMKFEPKRRPRFSDSPTWVRETSDYRFESRQGSFHVRSTRNHRFEFILPGQFDRLHPRNLDDTL